MALISPMMVTQNQINPAAAAMSAVPVAAPAQQSAPMTTTSVPMVGPNILPAGIPPTGLMGAEQAISTGASQAGGLLGGAINQIAAPNAYTTGGAGAAKLQADLSGANGPAAAAAAEAQLSHSPAAQYQMEQMQRATERSAAARGGLLGGNVAQELQRNAAGIASQDFQNQFANLGTVADRGANMQSQEDQIKASLTRDLADTAYSAGIQRGGLRMDAVKAIAQNASQAALGVSDLLKEQGVVLSDMAAKDISTITDIIYQSGLQDSAGSQQLAAILANIAGGQASTAFQGQSDIGAANAAGTIGVGNAIQGGLTQAIGAGLIK